MPRFNAPSDYRNTGFEPGNQQHNYSWIQLVLANFYPNAVTPGEVTALLFVL